jgi:hypothetical protein
MLWHKCFRNYKYAAFIINFCITILIKQFTAGAISLLPHCRRAPVGQGLLCIEALRSNSDTPQSAGLLWTGGQTDSDVSTWQHTTLITDGHPCSPRNSNAQYQQVSDRRPTFYSDRAATAIRTRNSAGSKWAYLAYRIQGVIKNYRDLVSENYNLLLMAKNI